MSEVETSTPEETGRNWAALAKESFGQEYKGEVVETPEAPEALPEAEVQPEIETESLESAPEVEAAETETPETEQTDGEPTIATLNELIEAEGYDQEEFLSLEVEQKVNGETRKVKLSEVLAANQTMQAAEERLAEAKENAKSQNQALAQQKQELESAFQVAAAVLQKQKQGFDAREKALASDPLREQDPAEWTARERELERERKAFDQELYQFSQAYQQQKVKTEQETEAQKAERLQKEQEILLEMLPDWKDEDARVKGQEQLGKYLAGLELSSESYQTTAFDSKLLVMAHKAMKYDEIQSKAEPAKKKLRSVPKTLKPGSKPAPVNTNQTEIARLQAELNANPNGRDALRNAAKIAKLRRGN